MTQFDMLTWILAILSILIVTAIYVILVLLITLGIRKYERLRHSKESNEDLLTFPK